jgi:hypothetical protein
MKEVKIFVSEVLTLIKWIVFLGSIVIVFQWFLEWFSNK